MTDDELRAHALTVCPYCGAVAKHRCTSSGVAVCRRCRPKAYRDWRRAEGLCQRCGRQPARPGRYSCERCGRWETERQRERDHALREWRARQRGEREPDDPRITAAIEAHYRRIRRAGGLTDEACRAQRVGGGWGDVMGDGL